MTKTRRELIRDAGIVTAILGGVAALLPKAKAGRRHDEPEMVAGEDLSHEPAVYDRRTGLVSKNITLTEEDYTIPWRGRSKERSKRKAASPNLAAAVYVAESVRKGDRLEFNGTASEYRFPSEVTKTSFFLPNVIKEIA